MTKKRVLIVHNFYQKKGGEDIVVEKMVSLFKEIGCEVECFCRSSKEIKQGLYGFINAFLSPFYNIKSHILLRRAIVRFEPDVINVHNLFPLISPILLYTIKKKHRVLMTVHNYRLMCPTGLFLRKGKACELCLEKKSSIFCGLNNCENSYFKSWSYAIRNAFVNFICAYSHNVDKFICLTTFQKEKLISAGYSSVKICVIPNSVNIDSNYKVEMGSYIAYIGRLSYEKGWDQLCELARRNPDIQIKFAGSAGSIELLELIKSEHSKYVNIEFIGQLSGDEIFSFLNHASFVVIPSRCYEGFPLAALEAFSMGKAVIAPRHGAFSEIISEGLSAAGLLYDPTNFSDMEDKVNLLWRNEPLIKEFGQKAIEKIQGVYHRNVVKEMWLELINE